MSYLDLSFPPGLYRNGTERQSKGRWYDANLMRFFEGALRPIGGWRKKARAGTLTDPFSTSVGTPTVTVAHTAHGLRVGDAVAITSAASPVGGLTMTGNWTVATVPGANSYTFTHGSNATSTAGPGGGSVAYSYTQPVAGKGRALLTWRDNNLVTWGGVGTHSKLYAVSRTGQVHDITPAGFSPGRADAVAGGGYGTGLYGTGTYGTPRPDTTLVQDASVWALDSWGEYLVGGMADDGRLYQWTLNPASAAAAISGAPTAAAMLVTEQRIMVALGANGNPRNVAWSDQEDNTVWTPSALNQAGDFDLQTAGKLRMGRRIRGAALLWTDLDVHLMNYTGDVFVHSFTRLADACGAISANCAAVLNAATVWMGESGFWLYNGFVQHLPCDVADYVFSDINVLQFSKVTCVVNSAFDEVTWFYPSGASTENDRYVTWSYHAYEQGRNVWTVGMLSRLSGADRGAMFYPWLMGSDGYVYEHEVGWDYGGAAPFLESGPIELGAGDLTMLARQLIPDDRTQGDVTATFKAKFTPNGSETSYGPYALTSPTAVRFAARQVKVRYTGAVLGDWRVGVPRLDLVAGGRR
jgi:hypothetical protein